MKISIIIPAQNEEDNLEKTVNSLLKNVTIPNYEILICNDHSTDHTVQIGQKLAKKSSKVKAVSNTGEKGFGNVLRFGFKKATGEFVLPVMADLCDDPKTINLMYKKCQEGYDVIVGSRYIKGGAKKNVQNHFKSICSWAVGQIGWYIQGIKTHDTTNAFKMMRRSAVLKAQPQSNTFDISLELSVKLHKQRCKFTEIPTVWTDRSDGLSKFKIVRVAKRYVRWIFERK